MNIAEFKKNHWIYSSKISLIGIAVVYLLTIALVTSLGSTSMIPNTIYYISLGFFVAFTTIWGMFSVSGAIISELRNRTWVYQKMSAIKAIDMCFGKLFGPTIYQWLLGAVFITVAVVLLMGFEFNRMDYLLNVINIILGTLLLHAGALVLSLLSIRRNEYATDTGDVKSVPMIVLMAIVVVQGMRSVALEEDPSSFTWYGLEVKPIIFNLVSLFSFTVWSMIAYYRNMREELQYQNRPFYWIAFNIFLIMFYSGLVFNEALEEGLELFNAYFSTSFAVLSGATLLALFLEPINVVSYNSLIQKIRAKKWGEALDVSPLWMLSIVFSFVICLMLCASLFMQHGAESTGDIKFFFLLPLIAFLFMIKSLLVNLLLHLAQVKRANFIWFLYMAMWYGLIPAVIGSWTALFLFYPTGVVLSGAAVSVYLVILLFFIQRTIRKGNVL